MPNPFLWIHLKVEMVNSSPPRLAKTHWCTKGFHPPFFWECMIVWKDVSILCVCVCFCWAILGDDEGWCFNLVCVCVCFRRAILGTCWMRKMILPQIVVNVRQDISETRDWLEDNPSSQGSQIWVLAKRVSNLPRCLKERQRKVCSLNPNDIQSLLEQQRMQLRQEGVEATGKDQVLLLSARCTARGTAHGPYMASPVGWNSANLLSLS